MYTQIEYLQNNKIKAYFDIYYLYMVHISRNNSI